MGLEACLKTDAGSPDPVDKAGTSGTKTETWAAETKTETETEAKAGPRDFRPRSGLLLSEREDITFDMKLSSFYFIFRPKHVQIWEVASG